MRAEPGTRLEQTATRLVVTLFDALLITSVTPEPLDETQRPGRFREQSATHSGSSCRGTHNQSESGSLHRSITVCKARTDVGNFPALRLESAATNAGH